MAFYLSSSVAVQDVRCAGDVFEMCIFEDTEAHCCGSRDAHPVIDVRIGQMNEYRQYEATSCEERREKQKRLKVPGEKR
jgi:hypothetical protein